MTCIMLHTRAVEKQQTLVSASVQWTAGKRQEDLRMEMTRAVKHRGLQSQAAEKQLLHQSTS